VAIIRSDGGEGLSHRKVTEAYIQSNKIPWMVLDDSSGYAADLYRVVTTPTTFLISPGGEIVDAWYYPHTSLEGVVPRALNRLREYKGSCTPRTQDPIRRASFSVIGPDGGRVPVDSLAERPSILHIWATWCAPCQSELPGLLKFRKTLEKKGGRLLLVSVEDAGSRDRVRAFGSRFESGFSSFLAPQGGLADQLDLSYTVPRTFLMSRGGTVIRELYGVQPWEDVQFQENVAALLQLPGS
jgi:thiol-disulfide isomerase/thioredoxin